MILLCKCGRPLAAHLLRASPLRRLCDHECQVWTPATAARCSNGTAMVPSRSRCWLRLQQNPPRAEPRDAGIRRLRGWSIVIQVRDVDSGQRNDKPARNHSMRRATTKSTSCWCGVWTAGAGRSPTYWPPFRNWGTGASRRRIHGWTITRSAQSGRANRRRAGRADGMLGEMQVTRRRYPRSVTARQGTF